MKQTIKPHFCRKRAHISVSYGNKSHTFKTFKELLQKFPPQFFTYELEPKPEWYKENDYPEVAAPSRF